jgi:hypothetical protein
LALAASICWIAELSAQGRNFSGTWVVDAERTAAANSGAVMAGAAGGGFARVGSGGGGAGARGGGGGGAVVAAPTGAGAVMRSGGGGGRGMAGPMTLAIDATSFSVGSGETATVYRLDGSLSTIPSARGDIIAKANWKGDQLVIETTAPGPNGPLVTTTTWYLEGESLVRVTSTPLADGQAVTRTTYFKKS